MNSLLATVVDRFWSTDRHIRIRLRQWAVTVAIYLASGVAMGAGVSAGLLPWQGWVGWCAFVALGLAVFYALLRTGRSRSFADQALTQSQIAFSVATVLWGYLMSGPVRSAVLFPMMVILTFGAFSLDWRRMAWLTLLALVALGLGMVALHRAAPATDVRVDLANFVSACIMLPAASMVASILGSLRVRLRSQRAELAAALERIESLASRDPLTGLHNRRRMQDELVQAQAGFTVDQAPLPALALIDLDHFKRINDLHGHGAGDEALRHFSQVASTCLRQGDSLARWGGEEFLLRFPGADLEAAAQAIERLRMRLIEAPLQLRDVQLALHFSAGLVQWGPTESIDEAIGRADSALYRAKHAGRGRTEVGHAAPPFQPCRE